MIPERRSVLTAKNSHTKKDGTASPSSYQITLPKWWCRKHGYPSAVYVSEQADGSLRVEVIKEAR